MDNECELGNSSGYGDFLEEVSFNAVSGDDGSLIEEKSNNAVRSPKVPDNKTASIKENLTCSTKNFMEFATGSPLNFSILASEDGSCLSETNFEMIETDFIYKNDFFINNGNEIFDDYKHKELSVSLIEINNRNKLDQEFPVLGTNT